jgi:DNA-binding GntR family transcriptional regulator
MKTPEELSEILSPPLKRSLADEVTGKLREAILSGRLKPGERLSENTLASSMNVSRGPVREAMIALEREGLVIVQRNRGTFVARLARDDLEEVYSLRRILEPLAVQRAIQYGTAEHFRKMQDVVDQMKVALQRGITGQESAALDLAFHTLIYEASQHRRLLSIWTALQPQIHILLLTRTVANPDFKHIGVAIEHQAILDMIVQKNEQQAVDLVIKHLNSSYHRIVKSYTQIYGEDSQ